MSTSNTINDIHADEYGNACRYYLPSGIPQSVQLGGVHIPADAHAPSHRSDTRSSVIPAWWRAHPRISPLMHTLICMEVTRRSCLCGRCASPACTMTASKRRPPGAPRPEVQVPEDGRRKVGENRRAEARPAMGHKRH